MVSLASAVVLACATKPTPVTVAAEVADRVSGVLDAYRDPECNCPVVTTFTGTLSGDSIDGTFTTRSAQASAPQSGTWRVTRKR